MKLSVLASAVVLATTTLVANAATQHPALSRHQAERIALAKVPHGHVRSAELENEQHALVWSFDITTPGTRSITEILVNANTGAIVDVQHETPKQQAAEAAEDRAHK